MASNSSSSAQLERQADATRAQVAETLDRIRSRMSPGQMVDQAIEYARDNGAAEFVRNLGQQVKASPLPVALIGTGIAWLMLSNGQSAARASAGSDGAAAVREQWRSASAALHGAASSVSDAGASAGESLRDAAASLSNGMPGQQAAMNFAREQPLVLGAVGLALGALLGAVLPSTRTEDELVGASSDAMKEDVKQTAEEQLELAVDAGGRAFNAASEEAKAQGLDVNAVSEKTQEHAGAAAS